ncbi:MAG: glycosyltransferase family 2 protein, partial [Candidatus Paceibacterota bacterium]
MTKSVNNPVSVIILTHRHDRRFVQALASAQPADEVLVIDFDSQNNWPSLSKQFQFKKIDRCESLKNFSVERNAAMKKAKHDWVFFLDSDEEIDSSSWKEIRELVKRIDINGVLINRRDIFYGKILRFGETGKVKLIRLMKKQVSQFTRPVHEIAQIKGKVVSSRISLLHFAHQNIAEFFQDISYYAQLEAEYQQDYLLNNFRLGLKTINYPVGKFCQNFFGKLGFLDGWRG